MIMNGDKKGLAVLIASKIKPGKEEIKTAPKNENGDEIDNKAGLDAAVQEMFDAFKVDNKDKFKMALESFIELCSDKEDEDEEESEDSENEQELE